MRGLGLNEGSILCYFLVDGYSLRPTSTLNYSGLTNDIITVSRVPAVQITAPEYEIQTIELNSWAFYEGAATGSTDDASMTLAKNILFPLAESSWGIVRQVFFSNASVSAISALAAIISNPPDIVAGDQIVFLGSPVWGDGDISVGYLYE